MKKLLLIATLIMFAGPVLAEELCEGFPDPLGGWRDRWLAQNSTMTNYYICSGSSTDEDYRGNNPCGLWICDENNDNMYSDIIFDPGFGATVTHFELGIMAFVPGTITMYDLDDNIIYQQSLVVDGDFPPCPTNVYGADTPNGLGRFTITPDGTSQIEGNTSVDDVCATIGGPTPTAKHTWGQIKAVYR